MLEISWTRQTGWDHLALTTDSTWNWTGMHIVMNPCMYHVGAIMDEPSRYYSPMSFRHYQQLCLL